MSCLSLMMLGCCLAAEPGFSVVSDRPVPELVQGAAFEQTLNQHISVRWENVDVRTILERLTTEYHIAFLRDRRIDADAVVSFSTVPKPARDVVTDVSALAGGDIRFVSNTAYVGPELAAQKLRTLIALRSEELASAGEITREHRQRLAKRQTIHWQDLDQPAEILNDIARQYKLKIVGGEQIPHDLWGGGTFIADSAAEALSLILVQFDLTFHWRSGATEIEFVPIPEKVVLERGHNPSPHSMREAAELITAELPGLLQRSEGGKIVVLGTIEEHETVERVLHPPQPKIAEHPGKAADDPLENERITLRVMGVPALALIKDLQKRYKMTFTYDTKALATAGIDLEQKVDIHVTKTTIDGYLAAFIKQVGAEIERNGLQVTIRPPSAEK
ncbi:hypothetical protein CA54_49310 [Symmachiella macrocystis]|uniref:Uncharacterized protein n=1 Tax=Symmachiella macrocystis TaxID=2527985 RepID=A0A5C6BEI3_9PLAN|nr:hypothetical protein [Symmachiella macrocystis]TWU09689.1 hypothetical protein CA54_49310 [Symmachiella macrocystis]